MPMNTNALLSKKVNPKDKASKKKFWTVFSIFTLLSMLLLFLFLDTRHKNTHWTYEDYLAASFDDATLPTGYQSDATLHFDGTSGYLLYDDLGQTLTTPSLGEHAAYRVSFRVAVLNVASPETYNESNPTFTLSAYDEHGFLVERRDLYNPVVNTTLSETFLRAEDVDYFVLKLTDYANLNGYQAYAGIDDFTIQTPREE